MKRLILLAVIVGMIACQKSEEIVLFDEAGMPTTRSITQNVSPVFDWWDTTSISLLGINSPVTLPWYNGASAQIPYYMLEDYKPEDGWEMVYNYCIDTPPGEEGKYYLMFYNKFTGILRVFYYNNHDVTTANTTLWRLEVTESTSLFNALGQFTLPMSERVDNPVVYVTNLTDYPSKSIARGWNCFDIELAYDDQLSQNNAHFNIGMYNMTSGEFILHGEIDLETDGTIVTHSSAYPGWVGSASKAAGEGAKGYVEKKLKGTSLEGSIANILSGGISSLASSGAKFLLGSLVGKKDNSYNSSVQLTTTGDVTLDGDFQVMTTPNTLPLANNLMPGCIAYSDDSFLPAYDEPLGVWSLTETPTVYVNETRMWCLEKLHRQEGQMYYGCVQQEDLLYYYPDSVRATVKINPAVLESIEKYDVQLDCIWEIRSYAPRDYMFNDITMRGPRGSYPIYAEDTLFVQDRDLPRELKGSSYPGRRMGFVYCSFWDVMMNKQQYISVLQYGTTFFPPLQTCGVGAEGLRLAIEDNKIGMKVTVTLYPKAPYDTTPIVLMRTYPVKLGGFDTSYTPTEWQMIQFDYQ